MNSTNHKILSPHLKQAIKTNRTRNNKRCFCVRAKGQDDYENYQVFQHKHKVYDNNVNVDEVNDHLEAVHKLKKEDKDDYFMSNGLDYNRCYEYINVVKYLNRCWRTASKSVENDNNKKWNLTIPGWSIIGILAFMYYFVKDDI